MSVKQELSAFYKIIKSPQLSADQLIAWRQSACPDAVHRLCDWIASALLDLKAYDQVPQILEDLNDAKPGHTLLKIRYYVATDQLDRADQFYGGLELTATRKRHAKLIMEGYLSTQYDTALRYYMIMLKYPFPGLEASDFIGFLNPGCPINIRNRVLDTLIGQPLKLTDVTSITGEVVTVSWTAPTYGLQKLDFTEAQTKTLINSLADIFKNRDQKCCASTDHYDYIVDGANVMHKYVGQIKGYRMITAMLNALLKLPLSSKPKLEPELEPEPEPEPRILLVLHQRHIHVNHASIQREIKRWEAISAVSILKTPSKFNDDYYSLLNAFSRPKSYLVTNDLLRDHIYMLSGTKTQACDIDLIKLWRMEKVIEFQNTGDNDISFYLPLPYSFRIQKINDYYLVPINDYPDHTKWLKIGISQ